MICLECAAVSEGGRFCVHCGSALVELTVEHVRRGLVRFSELRLEEWRDAGLVSHRDYFRLKATLEPREPVTEAAAPPPSPPPPTPVEPPPVEPSPIEPPAPRPTPVPVVTSGGAEPTGETLDAEAAGQGLFGRGAGALGGLDAFAALDATTSKWRSDAKSFLNEYLWWFLGTFLVLAGSVMGVREAWRSLGGVERQLAVTFALFVYHAGFVGLGALLSRKSPGAGKVLAVIAVGLLPVVFSGAASLTGLHPTLGAGVGTGLAVLTLVTMRWVARRFEAAPAWLGAALVPSLLAELPLGALPETSGLRAGLLFLGLVPVAAVTFTAWRRPVLAPPAGTLLAVALAGGLSLAIFASVGAPDADVNNLASFIPGTLPFAALSLFVLGLGALTADAALQPPTRTAWPRVSAVSALVALSIVAGSAVAAVVSAFTVPLDGSASATTASVGATLACAGAAGVFLFASGWRTAALHPALVFGILTGVMAGRAGAPLQPGFWVFGGALTPALALLVARDPVQQRRLLTAWGVVGGAAAGLTVAIVDGVTRTGLPWLATLSTGLLIAAAAHVSAWRRERWLHLFAGLMAVAALGAWRTSVSLDTGWALGSVLAGAVVVHRLVARVVSRVNREGLEAMPFDDLALLWSALALVLGFFLPPIAPASLFPLLSGAPASTLSAAALASAPLFIAAVGTLDGARRDRSRVTSTLGAALLVLAVLTVSGWTTSTQLAATLGSCALAFSLLASVRPREPASGEPRRFLGFVRLPAAASGVALFTDALAAVASVAVVVASLALLTWVGARVEPERTLGIATGAALVVVALVAFLGRGFVALTLRGSIVSLASAGAFIAVTAVVNRVGRPLPPEVVGRNLTLVVAGVFGVERLFHRFGPVVARWLENPRHGRWYHVVPAVGFSAIGTVLVVDALLVGAPSLTRALVVVPPLMLFGGALAALLLGWVTRRPVTVHAGVALLLPAGALVATQRALLGPALLPLEPPGNKWVLAAVIDQVRSSPSLWATALTPEGLTGPQLWQRAALGVAVVGCVLAALRLLVGVPRRALTAVAEGNAAEGPVRTWLAAQPSEPERALRVWSGAAALFVGLAAFFVPELWTAVLLVATGGLMRVAGARQLDEAALAERALGDALWGSGLFLVIHALAQAEPLVPLWPGPLLAACALVAHVLAPKLTTSGASELRLRAGASTYLIPALVYAFAAQGRTVLGNAGVGLLGAAVDGLAGGWLFHFAVPVTFALGSLALFVSALHLSGRASPPRDGLLAVLSLGFAAFTAVDAGFAATGRESPLSVGYLSLLTGALGTLGALGVAAAAGVAHGVGRWSTRALSQSEQASGRRSTVKAIRVGRDVLIVAIGVLTGAFVLAATPSPSFAFACGLGALGLGVAVSIHAALVEKTARHIYVVEIAVVGVYALVRQRFGADLAPELDAIFALVLGFALVGVLVSARRAGVPPVAEATRRVAAFVPVLVALLVPDPVGRNGALAAFGSGMLYAVLAAVERSKLFGALAAVAANGGLLLYLVSQGMTGVEIYLAPLGLLVLMLTQVLGLPEGARLPSRVVGGLLLYAPAAVKVVLQVGQAADGEYALAFGTICLLGVVAGMLFQIRAYLALGTSFLVLDVGATLVYAGLRNHRVGFVILSVTGLLILGGMVFTTLQREKVTRWVAALRRTLSGWE